MVNVRDVDARRLIPAVKEELKKIEEIKPPEWSAYAKSGVHKERPPEQPDFWYTRSASVLRRIYLDGPIGVEKLKTFYGGRKRRGTKPARMRKGSGSVIRKIVQQLTKVELIEESKKPHGRKITPKGQKFLDNVAYKVSKN